MTLTGVDSICNKNDASDEEQSQTPLVQGPGDFPKQCLIKRDKKTSTFYLYLPLTPSFTDEGKFLMAARRFRTVAYTEYIISLDANDFAQGSENYLGKSRSDFLRSNYTVYDSQLLPKGAKPSNGRRFALKQISPQVPAGNFEVGQVTYKLNFFKPKGPRRIVSTLRKPSDDTKDGSGFTFLKNNTPRWHELLQCWCLNFHGRVTIASIKNFQLVATTDQKSQPSGKETVLLQFGKVGDDSFTMDYREPFSAFQAFAICLTSFGYKLACQ